MEKQYPEIPTLRIFECGNCGESQVAAEGSALLCQNCVNTFLARNVGLMTPVEEAPQEEMFGPPKAEVPEVGGSNTDGFTPGGPAR